MRNLLRQFENTQSFTSEEAWLLFRLTAIGEAVGWSLLISGILLKRFVFHGDNAPVVIVGQIHGMLFFAYMTASIVLYPSLGWGRLKAIFAIAASVPPYGSLLFEQWASHHRQCAKFERNQQLALYRQLINS